MAVCNDERRRLPGLLEVVHREPTQTGTGVVDHRGQRLVDFVSNRGSHFSQGRHPRDMRKFRLCVAQGFFGELALGQVEHERDTLVPASFEHRAADQHGHAAVVFPEVLLLERLEGSGRS